MKICPVKFRKTNECDSTKHNCTFLGDYEECPIYKQYMDKVKIKMEKSDE